jgi:hypothetical protein
MIKTYSELVQFSNFNERYRYLRLGGVVGEETFGFHRYLNQLLYRSSEWRRLRDTLIIRDNGCDLGCEGFELHDRILLHHLNPISIEDVAHQSSNVFDPENLIITSHNTHQAIHYSDEGLLITLPNERIQNDTCPWRR